jgi:transcriptional regulator GlxA family with amidase domain
MKHVTVLIPEGDISLSNVEGLHHIFQEVNKGLVRAGQEPVFRFQLAGKRRENFLKENYFAIYPKYLIGEDFKTDLLIVPALHGDIYKSLEINKDLLPFIVQQYNQGAEVMSICTGTFLLASTGLLAGKCCTTHWIHAHEFRKLFPDVRLLDDNIMTDENGIYTSGASYLYLNLALYIIEKYTNREIAILIAKIFAIDMDKNRQSQFMIFHGYKHHKDESILKVQEYIEQNYQQKFTVEWLADYVSLGRRNFERRFKLATSHSVKEYIQRVKVEAAKKMLELGGKNINEVMYDVGYSDNKAFRDVFKKITGMSPTDYRNKYCKEVVNLAVA